MLVCVEGSVVLQHNLKIDRKWFDAVLEGRKKAEIRRADRDFAVGDQLLLYIPGENEGALVTVTHIVRVSDIADLGCTEPIAILSIDEPTRLAGDRLSAQLEAGDYGESHETYTKD